jgi:hypothetical protein
MKKTSIAAYTFIFLLLLGGWGVYRYQHRKVLSDFYDAGSPAHNPEYVTADDVVPMYPTACTQEQEVDFSFHRAQSARYKCSIVLYCPAEKTYEFRSWNVWVDDQASAPRVEKGSTADLARGIVAKYGQRYLMNDPLCDPTGYISEVLQRSEQSTEVPIPDQYWKDIGYSPTDAEKTGKALALRLSNNPAPELLVEDDSPDACGGSSGCPGVVFGLQNEVDDSNSIQKKYKSLLMAGPLRSIHALNNVTNGYKDLLIDKADDASIFKFNGTIYVASGCFSHDHNDISDLKQEACNPVAVNFPPRRSEVAVSSPPQISESKQKHPLVFVEQMYGGFELFLKHALASKWKADLTVVDDINSADVSLHGFLNYLSCKNGWSMTNGHTSSICQVHIQVRPVRREYEAWRRPGVQLSTQMPSQNLRPDTVTNDSKSEAANAIAEQLVALCQKMDQYSRDSADRGAQPAHAKQLRMAKRMKVQ